MKLLSESAYGLRFRASRQNIRLLISLFFLTVTMTVIYAALFLVVMAGEGKEHSWVTAFYWTITNMSTLGLGDIAFVSDIGRAFTIVVHLSGLVILLIFIPFLFVQLFQSTARAPRELPPGTKNHVILTAYDPIAVALIKRLQRYRHPYALVLEDLNAALTLYDQGMRVMVGDLHDPATFRNARAEHASLIASTAADQVNANIAYTIREVAPRTPLLTSGHGAASVEVLRGAGSSHVLELPELMGQALARRVLGADALAHIVGQVDSVLIAEAMVSGTPLVGKTLASENVSRIIGNSIVGVLDRGEFRPATPDTLVTQNMVLILAGSQEQIDIYNELFCIYHVSDAPVIIVGGGRVGRATGNALKQRGIAHRYIEAVRGRIDASAEVIIGNALDPAVLQEAGIGNAPAVIITSHDDDTNIFLTTYVRRMRADLQISSRATQETNIRTLHRAGADFVISYASMGANAIFNYLRRGNVLLVTEGLNVFKVPVPRKLIGTTADAADLQKRSGCCLIAVRNRTGMHLTPGRDDLLTAGSEMILIGTSEAEESFMRTFAAS